MTHQNSDSHISRGEMRLLQIKKRLDEGGEPEETTGREFMSWFGARRRRGRKLQEMRAALDKYDLTTDPDFQHGWVDAPILIKRNPSVAPPILDPTERISTLSAANRPPLSVKPNDPLERAVTLMIEHNFSQLPVMTKPWKVKGIISWSSIGKRLVLREREEEVRHYMESHTEIGWNESLLSAIKTIEDSEYVLVRNDKSIISGIVTSSDLSQQLHLLGEPFLLIGEIEGYIRKIIQEHFSPEELADAKDPKDKDREVKSVSNLSFGEYVRFLQNDANWKRLGINIDGKTFVNDLENIQRIRNEVMHFNPSEILNDDDNDEDEDMNVLRTFTGLLQQLAQLKVI